MSDTVMSPVVRPIVVPLPEVLPWAVLASLLRLFGIYFAELGQSGRHLWRAAYKFANSCMMAAICSAFPATGFPATGLSVRNGYRWCRR